MSTFFLILGQKSQLISMPRTSRSTTLCRGVTELSSDLQIPIEQPSTHRLIFKDMTIAVVAEKNEFVNTWSQVIIAAGGRIASKLPQRQSPQRKFQFECFLVQCRWSQSIAVENLKRAEQRRHLSNSDPVSFFILQKKQLPAQTVTTALYATWSRHPNVLV